MKLLLESWNKHLNENVTKDQLEQTIQKITVWCSTRKIAMEIVDSIPALKDHYIVKKLGAGTGGVAYQLSNGNVLKLYHSGAWVRGGTPESEDKEYGSVMDKMFSGKSFKGEIAVYSHGVYKQKSELEPLQDEPWVVGWVEMNKVTTLDDYYRLLKVPPDIIEEKKETFDRLHMDISSFLYQKFVEKDDDYYDAMEMFDESSYNQKWLYKQALTDKEIIAFKTGLFKFHKNHGYEPALDAHFENCGLMWPSDLSSFVVFDY